MYRQSNNRATQKYMRQNVYRLQVLFKKEYFEKEIKPYIEQAGMSNSEFVKTAISDKIEQMKGQR